MGLVVATTIGLVAWVTLWAIGAKSFDAFLLSGAIGVLAATAPDNQNFHFLAWESVSRKSETRVDATILML